MAHTSGNRIGNNARENGFTTFTDLLTHESREQELKEREEERQLFQETFPHAGNPSDILYLNVGGSTNVAVLRRILTIFENYSILAKQFSGRWDDKLPKTKCGSFFIDQDPKVFVPLLNYLRHCDHNTRYMAKIQPPPPTPEFCSMLEYYGLLSSIYSQQWRQVWGTRDGVVMTEKGPNKDSFTISSSNTLNAFAMDVIKPLNVRSFTAVFERGSTGHIGWAVRLQGSYGWSYPGDDSFGVSLDRGQFVCTGGCTFQGTRSALYDRFTSPVTILGTWDLTSNSYSIEIMENGSDTCTTGTCIMDISRPVMYPHVFFQGKVTISNVLYG